LTTKDARAYIVMGVSGCGKTAVGMALAKHLGCPFYDGDDFHTAENVAKMASGTPLDDADREPWLASQAEVIREHLRQGKTMVLANSALKKRYREQLQVSSQVRFIYLKGGFDLIWQRMQERQGHYMKAEMLRSQFEALEEPEQDEAVIVPIDVSVKDILALILRKVP
jgi:gluconokinase